MLITKNLCHFEFQLNRNIRFGIRKMYTKICLWFHRYAILNENINLYVIAKIGNANKFLVKSWRIWCFFDESKCILYYFSLNVSWIFISYVFICIQNRNIISDWWTDAEVSKFICVLYTHLGFFRWIVNLKHTLVFQLYSLVKFSLLSDQLLQEFGHIFVLIGFNLFYACTSQIYRLLEIDTFDLLKTTTVFDWLIHCLASNFFFSKKCQCHCAIDFLFRKWMEILLWQYSNCPSKNCHFEFLDATIQEI